MPDGSAHPRARIPGSKVERWGSPRCTLDIEWCTPRVLLFTYNGYIPGEVVAFFEPIVAGVIARGQRPKMFVDMWDCTGYESDFRREITRWVMGLDKSVDPFHLLVKSKIFAMMISVIRLAINDPRHERAFAHTDRLAFYAALRTAVHQG
jgi:hypothetical protein